MPFKLNISEKGKTYKLELESSFFEGKKLGLKFDGKEISPDLQGYELEIAGATDFAGFAHKKGIEGPSLRRVLLKKGWGMHKRPRREGKKKIETPKGLRLRKSYRGEQLSEKTTQINLAVLSAGSKKLAEIFPDQNKAPEPEKPTEATEQSPAQVESPVVEQANTNTEEIKEEIAEVVSEETKDEIPDSPETKTSEEKEEAAEKIGEEVAEQSEEVAEQIAEEDKKE